MDDVKNLFHEAIVNTLTIQYLGFPLIITLLSILFLVIWCIMGRR